MHMQEKKVVDVELPVKCSTVKNGFGAINNIACTVGSTVGRIVSQLSGVFDFILRCIGAMLYYLGTALALIIPIGFFALMLYGSVMMVINPEEVSGVTGAGAIPLQCLGVIGVLISGFFIIVFILDRLNLSFDIHCKRGE